MPMNLLKPPPAPLASEPELLMQMLRGIEKEGLRVDHSGKLADTPHPAALGSALTHDSITTDYSEALLELITGTHGSAQDVVAELETIHRFVARNLRDELIWNQSMPAQLPAENEIPIAWYGTSNTGMLKHVYRRGLAMRYGRTMQCIAGIHYNLSLPDRLWEVLDMPSDPVSGRRSSGYMALIRNFTRYSWLLMYLFGASPAASDNFLRHPNHGLELLHGDTWYLPHATSLRMSDLGYRSSKAQAELQLCYNDLPTFLARMHRAVSTPWPDYEAIGTHRDGEWIQLNTNILQVENEYYSNIRPKRTVGRGERPVSALARHGIEYVEVRCLDIDPWMPTGISVESCRFMDAFLLFCAAQSSPLFPENGFCKRSNNNFGTVVKEGRKPGLLLDRDGQSISLQDWGTELLDAIRPYAGLLDQAHGGASYADAVAVQQSKLDDSDNTPSARLLAALRKDNIGLQEFTLQQSLRHHETLSAAPLPAETQEEFLGKAKSSIEAQARIEQSDKINFETYVAQYQEALKTALDVPAKN
ncbi:glutamate-cysteine ligase [Paracandidimonas soli]|uniref:Glutamate--cysteine ligase n=2 Tax=Paracandidimonas soli TaxID=1917182 RepID=A0A4R3USJ7_9BURK|nr:glutamate-cysteine ligase [Paracandidimonas soli]